MPANKRAVLNLNFPGENSYAFINATLHGEVGPFGSTYATGTLWNADNLDSEGWPEVSFTSGREWGGTFAMPASSNFAGPYVITWEGRGTFDILAGTWTVDTNLSSNYTELSNGRWSGTDPYIVASVSGSQNTAVAWRCRASDPASVGAFAKRFKIYRLEDEADLDAGKLLRTAWKQIIVDLHPGALRFMNFYGGNDAQMMRFESRPTPLNNPTINKSWLASLPYGETTGTNQYELDGVAGTPAVTQHGELVTCRIGIGLARAGRLVVTSITKANPGVVTTSTNHGFNDGDVVVMPLLTVGMTELNYRPVTVANKTDTTFEILDTSGFTTHNLDAVGNSSNGSATLSGFASTAGIQVGMTVTGTGIPAGRTVSAVGATTVTLNSGASVTAGTGTTFSFAGIAAVMQYITLDVDGRGAYPVIFSDGTTPASNYGDAYIASGNYKSFWFDKTMFASTEVGGAWIFNNLGANNGPYLGVPLEYCVKMMNEINAMCVAQGKAPIDMWINTPHRSVLSMDDDHTEASNPAIGTVDVILNGANGYDGLLYDADLLDELSNETWNSGGAAFAQAPYMARQGFLRTPSVGTTDSAYMTAVRTAVMSEDIRGAFPGETRIKIVMAGQGIQGPAGSGNTIRINGSAAVDADPAFIAVGGGEPYEYWDYFAWAGYWTIEGSSYETTNLATLAANYAAATTQDAREAVMATYVDALCDATTGSQTVNDYKDTLLPAYNSAMAAIGKNTIMYEGWWDRQVTNGGSAEINAFLVATKRSRAWAHKTADFMWAFSAQSNAYYPAVYIMVDARWGFCTTDTYLNGVEGANLSEAWERLSLYNHGKKRFTLSLAAA